MPITINQHVVIDRRAAPKPSYELFFEGITVNYALELEDEDMETILKGEARLREVLNGKFTGTLDRKLITDNSFGVRKVTYGSNNGRFLYLTLSVHSMTPTNYYNITRVIADHIDYCRAATLLLPTDEYPPACDCHG